MATKRAALGRPKTGKASVRLFVCDDVRQELNKKLSLVGLYADGVVIVYRMPDAPEGPPDKPLMLDSLTLLIVVSGLVGSHKLVVRLLDEPADLRKPIERNSDFGDGSRSATLIAKFRPYAVPAFGLRRVLVEVDGRSHKLTFEIRDGGVAAPETGDAAPPRPAAKAATSKKARRSVAKAA